MFKNPITAFPVGRKIPLGEKQVTKQEIIEFAEEFDPVFFHLDEEAAKNSILGGLSASGFHTCSMAMRLICDGFLLQSSSQGAPGVDIVRWIAPVKPGDTLIGEAEVVESRQSKSRPTIMIVKFQFNFWNQNKQDVLEMLNSVMFEIPQEARIT